MLKIDNANIQYIPCNYQVYKYYTLLNVRYSPDSMVNFVYMDTKVRISKLVRTYRNLKGLTQTELARAAGTQQQRINEIEVKKHESTIRTLEKIVKILGIPPEKIFDIKPIGDETF